MRLVGTPPPPHTFFPEPEEDQDPEDDDVDGVVVVPSNFLPHLYETLSLWDSDVDVGQGEKDDEGEKRVEQGEERASNGKL